MAGAAASDPDDEFAAREQAIKLLARREHSRLELQRKLSSREYSAEAIRLALDQLEDERLLSEERFAEVFVRSRAERGKGPLLIRSEMSTRGVNASLIHAALQASEADWFDIAQRERRKKFGASPPADFKDRQRQTRFLQQRGFSLEHIRETFASQGPDKGA